MSNVIAFFDMDRTILSDSSGLLYMRYLRQKGQINLQAVLRVYWHAALYGLGLFNYPATMAKVTAAISGDSEADMIAFCQRWFDEVVINYIAEKAVQRMDDHRAQGHLVTILSAATPYAVGPVASHIGADDYLCTRLEVVNGRFTGRFVEPACYGEGKVFYAEQYTREHGSDLSHAYFYTDGHSDLPLLEQIGHPVAVNPDARLKATAQRRGWPIEYLY
ncbi:MAG TPA: HAD family hydrolase [Anaerolineae bacterium]|nr:HAD family hydrolase [Anaerolineae bacterium]